MRTYILKLVEDDYWGIEYAEICSVENQEETYVGSIGGEPEDNTYYRTYEWILPALNEAYNQGVKDGAKKEYNRLLGSDLIDCVDKIQ